MAIRELTELRPVQISELGQSNAVMKRLVQIREHLRKEANGRAKSFFPSEFGPETAMDLFPDMNLMEMDDYLDSSQLEVSHEETEMPYRVYSVSSSEAALLNVLENCLCDAYHRVILQVPEGILTREFGEIREPIRSPAA